MYKYIGLIFLSLFLLACTGISLNSQVELRDSSIEGRLEGIIIDKKSRNSLAFVNLKLVGKQLRGTETNSGGLFQLDKIPSGWHSLQLSYLGYKTVKIDSVLVEPGESTQLEIEMEQMGFLTEQIVVTATRKSQTISQAPVSVDVISSEDLKSQNVNTFDEAFNGITGIYLTRSSKANTQALSIRGASEVAGGGIGNRVLLLVDGRPALSPESGGALWNLVPTQAIQKIEVIKGAYSSLFGSSAMGGVINVITKEARQTQTNINVRYGFYNRAPSYTAYTAIGDFHSFNITHTHKFKDSGLVINFSRKQDDGHREKSSFSLYNFFSKFQHKISTDQKINISLNYNKIYNDTPATWLSRRQSYSVADHRKDDFQDKKEMSADLMYSWLINDHSKVESRLYYYKNSADFSFNDDPDNDSTNVNIGTSQIIDRSSVDTRRFGHNTQLDFNIGNRHYLIMGYDLSFDHIVGLPDTVLYGTHDAFNAGLYVQEEFTVNSDFVINAGIRYDYYKIKDNYSDYQWSPKLSMVYRVNEKIAIRALAAQAFRYPAIAERFIKFEQGGGLRFQPNPSLRTEKLNLSLELGTNYQIANQLRFDAAIFYNNYSDLISFQQIANPQGILLYKVVNLNRAIMQGIETNLSFSFYYFLKFRLGYTYLDAKDTSDDRFNDALAYKRKHSFSFFNSIDFEHTKVHIQGLFRSRIKEVFIYPGSEPDSHFLMHAKIETSIKENLSFYLALDNIFDKQYEEIERYRMAGRTYSLGANIILDHN